MANSSDFIVVGVDGADAANHVATWAADEASRRHSELRLVHAYWLPASAGYPDDNAYPDDLRPVLQEAAERMLDQTAADLRRTHPDLTITTRLQYKRPTVALRDESEHALFTVVGSGNASRIYGVLLGSVALAIASTNPAPVAVIHPEHTEHLTGPVVVGVDGSHTSDAAVAFAFQAAATRKTNLVAVHVWDEVFVPGSHKLQNPLVDPARIQQEEQAILAERITGWADKFPDVSVQQNLAEGRAVTELLDYAERAQMLIVGSHGRGGFAGMLLGSTSHSLIIHSPCPVVVVRTAAGD
jgi:nucleotide-binding universal stress UspA family protein